MNEKKENFRLVRLLGSGAFGHTYLVEVTNEKKRKEWGVKEAAIKIPISKEKEKILIEELIFNATLHSSLQGLKAPNIVRYIGFDSYDGNYVMVMEYMKGCDLRKTLGDIGSQTALEIEQALDITKQVCKGLIAIHKSNIFHRDIKPENIYICEDGIVKIMDLGISKVISSKERASSTAGTIYYMPKEILKGEGGSFYSDIYSLGVTVYEMVTGELPYIGNSITEIIDNICNANAIPPKTINRKIDERLNFVIMKAIQPDVEKRYRKVEDLLDAIESYGGGAVADEGAIETEIAEAMEFYSSDRLGEAEKLLKEIVEKYPKNVKAYLGLGEYYNRRHQYSKAIDIFKKGLERIPNNGFLYRDLALSYYQQGALEKAIEYIKVAIQKGLDEKVKKHAEKLLELWEKAVR